MSTALAAFTLFHVALSLVGILAGLVVVFALISGKQGKSWTATFLLTAAATSLTGPLFPFHKLLPSQGVGIVSLLAIVMLIFIVLGVFATKRFPGQPVHAVQL
jgi:FtsH-binding integral membrane protein